jgi:integrase
VRGSHIGTSLTGQAIAQIVKARAKAAGLELDVSAHSLRSGFITEAGLQGIPIVEVMRLSGHRSVPQAMAYYQGGNVLNSVVATLFDTEQGG